MECWRLDDGRQTLVLASRDARLPEIIHWGAPLPAAENLAELAESGALDVTGGMLDTHPALSICPEAAASFPGEPGLVARGGDGALLWPRFRLTAVEDGADTLTFTASDDAGLTYRATFAIDGDTHIISARASMDAAEPIRLSWLAAPVFPAPALADDMLDFTGRWCGEFQTTRTPWSAGARARRNPTGRTGHEHFPGLVLPVRGATNTAGEAYAFHYAWSGGHTMVAEELPDGRRQVQFGHARDSENAAATRFETGTLYATYAPAGINGCAVAFQRHLRDKIVTFPGPITRRPVHYNCWEAVYFEHTVPTLKEIATRAAALGAERFVLDDGWSRGRNDDRRALGDWTIDPHKYPDGLGPLVDHVLALGMEFGIWFEPEMLSPDSDLCRAHPEWVLGPQSQVLGRHQLALDMTRADVQDAIFERISAVLSTDRVSYVKWDHNRVLPVPDAAQARATYGLIDRLTARFPRVEFESCASGGARIDFEILARTQRVWLSDSNDALERLRIQHEAALFLPMVVTGSHVGPATCHTSGRALGIGFRAWVAAQRHLGFEMDPRELSEADAAVLRQETGWWKDNRAWLARADILRLDSADAAVLAEEHLAEGGERFVVFAGKAETSRQIAPRPLCLTGLEPQARYTIALANRDDALILSRADLALKRGTVTLSGAALMGRGISLPWSFPATMWVIEGRRIEP